MSAPLSPKDRARLAAVALHAAAPPILLALFLWRLFESPEAQGWRLLALRSLVLAALAGSLWIAFVSARAWIRRDARTLRKGYGVICDEPEFWIRALRLPPDYFDPPPPPPAPEPSHEAPLWTELEPEEIERRARLNPDPSAIPRAPKPRPPGEGGR